MKVDLGLLGLAAAKRGHTGKAGAEQGQGQRLRNARGFFRIHDAGAEMEDAFQGAAERFPFRRGEGDRDILEFIIAFDQAGEERAFPVLDRARIEPSSCNEKYLGFSIA